MNLGLRDKILLAIIPLIFTIGITTGFQFADATYHDNAYRIESETECRSGQVLVLRTSQNDYLCVDYTTAKKWEGYGMAEIVGAFVPPVEEPVACTMHYDPVCGADGITYGNSCMLEASGVEFVYEGECREEIEVPSAVEQLMGIEIDYEAELSLVPKVRGGTTPLTVTPVLGTPDRAYPITYSAGTEELAEDEMRITFCGTGMPFPVYQQASACVIVELGNGDVFLFDLGANSIGRVNGMLIDTDKLNKIFLGHLHLDHAGDLGILWAQGGWAGRSVPLEVYGPSGPNHELGTQVFVENTLAAGQWDLESRKVGIPTVGMAINTHEFEWSQTQVVYEENGVTITSFPAIHILDGAVSYRLDWNGLSFVFSSDTEPNQFLVENSQNVDLLIHEGFVPAQTMSDITGMPLDMAITVSEDFHTPPDAAGVVFSLTEPRLAALYHVILTQEVVTESFELLRTTYDGPALYGEDLVTINVTPDYIISRLTEIDKNPYPEYKNVEGEIEGSEFGKSEWLEEARIDWKAIKEEIIQGKQ